MKSALLSCLLVLLLFSMPSVAQTPSLSVHGSTVFIAAVLEPNKKALETETGLTLDVVGNSAGEGVEELVKGETPVAMITGSFDDIAAKINAKKPSFITPSSFKAHEIGMTRVAFAVHPTNPLVSLNKEQITGILKGEITNWKEVGGDDKPIILITGVAATGLRAAVEKEFLSGASITDKAKTLVNSALIGAVVEKAPTALGILVVDMLSPSMKEITVPNPEHIKLSYVTKGDPSSQTKKLIDATLKLMKK